MGLTALLTLPSAENKNEIDGDSLYRSLSDKPRVVDTIDSAGDPGDIMMATGRSLSSRDEAWVVPMLIISAISVSVITIYQVSMVIKSFRSNSSLCSRLSSLSVPTDPVRAEDISSYLKCCS